MDSDFVRARSAFRETFADTDDRSDAVNIVRVLANESTIEVLRTHILWIPIGIVAVARILSLIFNRNLFNGYLKQGLEWMDKTVIGNLSEDFYNLIQINSCTLE